jgi:hypothetical protein
MILLEDSEEFDILLKNGMFRNREPRDLALPISGSDADFIYDDVEVAEYAKILGCIPAPVAIPGTPCDGTPCNECNVGGCPYGLP